MKKLLVKLLYEGVTDEYKVNFLETEGFTCVYALKKTEFKRYLSSLK